MELRKIIKNKFLSLIKFYYRNGISKKVNSIRNKDKISVLFIISDIAKWKSKSLYELMLVHSRFNPQVGVTMRIGEVASENARKTNYLLSYLNSHNINYIELLGNGEDKKFDIIIYQEPYIGSVPIHNSIYGNLGSLFISIHYGFHTTVLPTWYTQPFHDYCWFDCFENLMLAKQIKNIYNKRKNIVVTGLPMTDDLMTKRINNPWKSSTKKKIIWAPHHSIGFHNESITYSNFLSIAEDMKELAIKYSKEVQWAFKPHPWLRSKVEKIWGKEKTDEYFIFWENFESSQAEYGEYVALFQYSDAMIHDSSSFIIEYLYTLKPVMFIDNGFNNEKDMNRFAQEALKLHIKGNSIEQIETFVIKVLRGEDIMLEKRKYFYNNYLLPPANRSASENIINRILGNENL